ncbi:MAG TPA: ribbon-helix-helix domain-containing protein [Candidatus Sutterella merdavium]|nr:ribbon-helix-helix domain-containing protein [Candidatus Sutterella merdavium]
MRGLPRWALWNLSVPPDFDEAVRLYLASQGR